jgi:hypothetical protein
MKMIPVEIFMHGGRRIKKNGRGGELKDDTF